MTVLLAQIGGLPAVVEAEDDTDILLSLSVQAPAGLARVLDRPVRIECVSARGIQRITGHATWSPDAPDQLRSHARATTRSSAATPSASRRSLPPS